MNGLNFTGPKLRELHVLGAMLKAYHKHHPKNHKHHPKNENKTVVELKEMLQFVWYSFFSGTDQKGCEGI